jgi:aryl sulfotransferase
MSSSDEGPPLAATRVYRHHHLDSTRWEQVRLRPDDIVVTTPYKCGTTWTQRILAALIHGPEQGFDRELSPWIDARYWGPIESVVAGLEAQQQRRFLKSHLPLDGMPWYDEVSYVVVGRDPRDIFMSLLNHYASYGEAAMTRLNDPGNPGPPMPLYGGDPHELWRDWIGRGWFPWEMDGWPFWSAFHHLETWWSVRDRPNVLLVHFADLKADPDGEIARLAAFLDIERTSDELARIKEVTSFSQMREELLRDEAAKGGPDGSFFEGGMATFMFKGTNGRWRDLLTVEELDAYEARAAQLDDGLRAWLEQGRLAQTELGA